MATLCREAEQEEVGALCGLMLCALAIKDHAVLLNCRTQATAHVALPTGTSVVVMEPASSTPGRDHLGPQKAGAER